MKAPHSFSISKSKKTSKMNITNISERFTWALKILRVKPSQSILEIGCGAGLLAELIAGKLTTGTLVALDKSASMLEKAKKRNKAFIDNGISNFMNVDFLKSQLPENVFDTVVAFNVPAFWKNPAPELALVRQLVKQTGKLYLFRQEPYDIEIGHADRAKQTLLNNSFQILDVQVKEMMPTSVLCIIAKPQIRPDKQ
jgi:SAM-dependent methyltransferase